MKNHLFLLLALASTITHLSRGSDDGAAEATDAAGGESDPPIAGEGEGAAVCEPTEFLLGGGPSQPSSCDGVTFAIATLTPPRRCIHIESPPDDDDGDDAEVVCNDFPDWFDGTNGCDGYARHEGWCAQYGDASYKPHTPYKPREACCACGGGTPSRARLRVGEYVAVAYEPYAECDSLRIAEVRKDPHFRYVVEVKKECGPRRVVRDPRTGRQSFGHTFQPGNKVSVRSDDPDVISRRVRVELRKCRAGTAAQEFRVRPMGSSSGGGGGDGANNHSMAVVDHVPTGADLAAALGSKSPFVNVTRVWEGGTFEGSGDFFFATVARERTDGRVRADGTPYDPIAMYLASGCFGEKEYSLVQTHSLEKKRGLDQQEFSMWQFRPFQKGGPDGDASAVDEHSEWLVRMTRTIGIDYLEQLPPWHLLDVERDASKGDVKARFRELSRSFHPDKLVNDETEKKELFERIFVLLQNAYQGLKGADEREKEEFRVKAESGSQLFAHSQYVVELLPFHWTKIDDGADGDDDDDDDDGKTGSGRYILNAASHLNSTFLNVTIPDEENEPSVQIWVTFMYSARCGMSKTVVGFVDLAARHLERHENIKVGAYGCGLYKDHPPTKNDPTGVQSDPICAQFRRKETPNVHVIVETLPGWKRDESGELAEVPPDPELVKENALFKYFYKEVPTGDTTQFYPHNFIEVARAGKRVWKNNHLVRRMTPSDFIDPEFVGNSSIVAYLDGTGKGETNAEIVDAITTSLPGVARRFLADGVYVGIAQCGYGDEYVDEDDAESQKHVDCSKLGVSWLPDIKIYRAGDNEGVSLLRGQFGDIRDVQIALESMGNVLRMMIGGTDDDFEDDFEEMEDDDKVEDVGGSCGSNQPPPPPPDYDLDLDELDGRMEDTPLLDTSAEEKFDEPKPALENDSNPSLGASKLPEKPKLASSDDRPRLSGGRERTKRDRISGFYQRETKKAGRGQLLGGGGGGSAGFIA